MFLPCNFRVASSYRYALGLAEVVLEVLVNIWRSDPEVPGSDV